MQLSDSFEHKLENGQQIEYAVATRLRDLLPGYEVINTPQDNDIDRMIYCLIDVVVMKGDHICFGVECKYSQTKLNNCKVVNGWDGDYNTVINRNSLREYKEAYFPVYFINYNSWCNKSFTTDLQGLLRSGNDAGKYVKYSGDVRYNIDSRTWDEYDGFIDERLTDILSDILKKEKLC